MEYICKKFSRGYNSLLSFPYEGGDINKLAAKYKLTIYYNNGELSKSDDCGKEIFVVLRNDMLFAHTNPGKLAKLPTGVGKLNGCKYNLEDFLECSGSCNLATDWTALEKEHRKGINIWRKISKGLNKNKILNIRRSRVKPALHLHCDNIFNKVFLVTSDKLYFRGNRHVLN